MPLICEKANLLRQINAPEKLGVENFVLHEGWFDSLITHAVSEVGMSPPNISPNGLNALADHAHRLGMQLDPWFESEMVHPYTVSPA